MRTHKKHIRIDGWAMTIVENGKSTIRVIRPVKRDVPAEFFDNRLVRIN